MPKGIMPLVYAKTGAPCSDLFLASQHVVAVNPHPTTVAQAPVSRAPDIVCTPHVITWPARIIWAIPDLYRDRS